MIARTLTRNPDQSYTDVALEIHEQVEEFLTGLMNDYAEDLHPDDISTIVLSATFCAATMKTMMSTAH